MFPVIHFQAPDAQEVIAYVGGFTSLFAAVIAITQYDIKRVLAFSTLSQLGYMMLSLGVSGYGGEEGLGYMASMFHLFTHAMFKRCYFLAPVQLFTPFIQIICTKWAVCANTCQLLTLLS